MTAQSTPPQETNVLIRINALLEKAIQIGGNNTKICMDEVWARVFDITEKKDGDPISYQKCIINQLIKLDDAICEALAHIESENLKIPLPTLKNHLSSVRKGVSPLCLKLAWKQIRDHNFTDTNLAVIKVALNGYHSDEFQLNKSEIDELKDLCTNLKQAIEKSKELPDSIKESLLKRIKSISLAIETIKLFGIHDLQYATNELAGMILTNPEVYSILKNDPIAKKDGIAQDLVSFITKISFVLNKACKAAKNIEYLADKGKFISELLERAS